MGSLYFVKALVSKDIPPVYPGLYVPRNRTVMVQIHLKSALQDDLSCHLTRWHRKADGKGFATGE